MRVYFSKLGFWSTGRWGDKYGDLIKKGFMDEKRHFLDNMIGDEE
jgi:hypothetical protein